MTGAGHRTPASADLPAGDGRGGATERAAWRAALAAGALAGALALPLFGLVEQLGALAVGRSWAAGPWLPRLLRDLGVGLVAGGVAGVLAEAARSRCAARQAPLVWATLAAAMLPLAARTLLSAALRGHAALPGGRPAALGAALLLLLAWFVMAAGRLHRSLAPAAHAGDGAPSRSRPRVGVVVARALLLVTPAPLAVELVQLRWLSSRAEQGLATLALLAAALAAGLALGVGLTARKPAARLVAAALVVAGLFAAVPGLAPARGTPSSVTLPAASPPSGAPNVLLVVLDTLRRDQVSAYGLVEGSTPRLDALAARGLRFDDCLANGCWTVPSHASLFTGAEVGRHGADRLARRLRLRPGGPDSAPLPTLAELLLLSGFETAAVVCNMNVSAAAGFDRGFGAFHEVWRARQGDHDLLALLAAWCGLLPLDEGGALATRAVTEFIAARAEASRPWLLFVNLLEAHAPFGTAPEPYRSAFLAPGEPSPRVAALAADPLAHVWQGGVSAEDAEVLWRLALGDVQYQDALLGQILDALERSGRAGDTLVVVTSDHGEHFGRHGLLGHGQTLDGDLLAVPLVMAGPGLPAGAVDDSPAALVDLLPTLLALTGRPALPADAGRTGRVLAGPAAVASARPRLAQKLAVVGAPGQDLPDGLGGRPPDPRWAAPEAALVDGPHLYLERELAQGSPWPAAELRARVAAPRPPADDGWRPVEDALLLDDFAARLAAALSALPPVAAPAPDEAVALDAATAAALAALGYAGDDR